MLIPIGGAFGAYGSRAWPALLRVMCALGAVAVATSVFAFVRPDLASTLFVMLLIGVFFFGWVANYFIIKYQ